MKRFLLSMLVICSMFYLQACPKKETLKVQSAKLSYSFSGLTVDAINAVGKAYTEGKISVQTKDKWANKLKFIATGGKRVHQNLEKFINESGANLPTDKAAIISKIFSDEVITPLLEILQDMKLMTADRAEYLRVAINALRTAILTVGSMLGSANIEVQKLEEVKNYVG